MNTIMGEGDAKFSPCRAYRYSLVRSWDIDRPTLMFIGLNPSTATETLDDPTIRRCLGYARRWGYGRLFMGNLFAFRATDPRKMAETVDPVGPENDAYLTKMATASDMVVAAWGARGGHLGRDAVVRAMIPRLHCLSLTKGGMPGHPLYLPARLWPKPWEASRDDEASVPPQA